MKSLKLSIERVNMIKKLKVIFEVYWIVILIAFAALLLLSGCKTTKEVIKYVEVPKISIQIDSVYTHSTDSFIEKQKGDTLYKLRWKTLYKDRVSIKTDTITKVLTQRIETIKEVKVRDKIWYLGLVGLVAIVLLLLWKLKVFFKI